LYQDFVHNFGIAQYCEVNPALFAAAIFLFLLRVMYDDIDHDLFLFLGDVYFILSKGDNDVMDSNINKSLVSEA